MFLPSTADPGPALTRMPGRLQLGQESILEAISQASIDVYVVWEPMLGAQLPDQKNEIVARAEEVTQLACLPLPLKPGFHFAFREFSTLANYGAIGFDS
jgi:hypothetical protein